MKHRKILALTLAALMLCSCAENDHGNNKSDSSDNGGSSAQNSDLYEKACNYQLYYYTIWDYMEGLDDVNSEDYRMETPVEFGFYDVAENKYYTYSHNVLGLSSNGYLLYADFEDFYEDDIKYGYIDSNDNVVIEAKFDYAEPFNESGYAVVGESKNDDLLYGFINTKGEYIIEPKFKSVENFSKDGIALAEFPNSTDYRSYYIGTDGEIIPELEKFDYWDSTSFNEYGVAFTGIKDENVYGLIDTQGNWIYKCDNISHSYSPEYLGENYFNFRVDGFNYFACGDGNVLIVDNSKYNSFGSVVKNGKIACTYYTDSYYKYHDEYGELNDLYYKKLYSFEENEMEEFENSLCQLGTYDLKTKEFEAADWHLNAILHNINGDNDEYFTSGGYEYCEFFDMMGFIWDVNDGNFVTSKYAYYKLIIPFKGYDFSL